ncbi:MAG: GNAT family N-acetyltransferase [Acidobacteriota bacterium]|nr:GNAT family N-acetyltransferase [Acidobacteriota bacterium]
MRRLLDDARLAEILGHPLNELWHVLEGDRPVGFAELDLRHLPDVELVYFGLIQGCIGTGVGPWFLRSMMDEMWSRPETGRFWLHTCELDHPRALSFYQRCGLRIFKAGSEPAPSPSQQLLW